MFPEIEEESTQGLHGQLPLPVLDSATRKIIVEIVEALVEGDEQAYMKLVKLTASLVPDPDDEGLHSNLLL